jgi:hypothetical protein
MMLEQQREPIAPLQLRVEIDLAAKDIGQRRASWTFSPIN